MLPDSMVAGSMVACSVHNDKSQPSKQHDGLDDVNKARPCQLTCLPRTRCWRSAILTALFFWALSRRPDLGPGSSVLAMRPRDMDLQHMEVCDKDTDNGCCTTKQYEQQATHVSSHGEGARLMQLNRHPCYAAHALRAGHAGPLNPNSGRSQQAYKLEAARQSSPWFEGRCTIVPCICLST